jgi:hypothetical protein
VLEIEVVIGAVAPLVRFIGPRGLKSKGVEESKVGLVGLGVGVLGPLGGGGCVSVVGVVGVIPTVATGLESITWSHVGPRDRVWVLVGPSARGENSDRWVLVVGSL